MSDRSLTGAAEEIRFREQEAANLLAAIPDVVSRIGPDLRFRYISPGIERLTGKSPREYIGRTHLEAGIAQETSHYLDSRLQLVLNTGQPGIVEFAAPIQDGTLRYFAGNGMPEFDENGNVSGVLTIVRDVTNQKMAEQRIATLNQDLERRVREFEILLEVLPVGIAVASDPECHDIRLNPKFAEMLGIDSQENASKTGPEGPMLPFKVYHEGHEVPDDDLPMQIAARERQEIRNMELEILRNDGTRLTELCFAKPLYDEQQNVRGSIGVFLDVTERKEALEALRTSNENLRVANADLQQFAYAAAHDLQEPLRNISLYTQLLEKRFTGQLDEEGEKFLRFICEGAVRMQQLVRDLLAYTRVVDNSPDSPPSPANTDAILRQALDGLRATLEEADAAITWGELPNLAVAAPHLTQLFQNLVSNAVKYAKPGTAPEIRISAIPGEKGHAILRVADNGIGIAPEFQDRVFGVFKRLHGRNIPGTGIGLAICRKIVDYYGGRIWVESEGDNQGCTFCFSLPCA